MQNLFDPFLKIAAKAPIGVDFPHVGEQMRLPEQLEQELMPAKLSCRSADEHIIGSLVPTDSGGNRYGIYATHGSFE